MTHDAPNKSARVFAIESSATNVLSIDSFEQAPLHKSKTSNHSLSIMMKNKNESFAGLATRSNIVGSVPLLDRWIGS